MTLISLWLPVLLAAVAVFILSSIVHMGPLWHRNDYPALPQEEAVRTSLQPLRLPPGDYMVPRPTGPDHMHSPEFREKLNQGPVMVMTVMANGPMGMGRNLLLWFAYILVTVMLAAAVTSQSMASGADFNHIFKLSALTAFLGFVVALWQMSIWYRRSLRLTLGATLDGILYALATGGIFAWLWPR